mgnify:CR=1 FL=1
MRGPAELAARAAVRYQRVYAAWAANPEQARAEVLPLSLDPPTQDLALADVDGVAAWIAAWRQWEHSAPGTVTWEGRRWASLGTQHLPVRAQLVGADAIASAAGRAGHWGLASSRAEMIAEMLQALGVGPTGLPGQGGAAEAVAAVIGEVVEYEDDDVERLVAQWEAIEKKASSVMKGSGKAPVLLKGEPELAVRVIRDVFNEDFRKLIVSGDRTWSTISQYIDEVSPDLAERLEHWTGPEEVFAAHRVDEQLAKGFDRKVWLPSGGTLVIDRTEAMTVIDVNTGRFTGAGGTLEETVTRNNLEAAEEIVRQLRLRDIGGMVVIDFVDMVLESNRDLVLRRLVECLGRDRTRHQVTEVTSLGLVQMTRKRVGQGLVEAFSTTCEHCKGRGFIVHDEPVENQQVDMSASASRGSGRSRGRKNREEQAAAGKKEGKKDSQKTKGSKSAKGSGRGKGSGGRDVVGSPESGADDEARAAVRGALAQIAAAAEQAHKEAEQESPESQEAVGPQGSGEEQVETARDAVEDGNIQDTQDTQTSTGEDGPARSRARKSAEKASERKAAKRTGKKTEKAEKKTGKKTAKKAEKKAGNGLEDPAEQQPGETSEESVGEKPARRTRRRATAKSTASSSGNSSETSDASA